MPTQIIKKYGAGQEFTTAAQLKTYILSLDLVATDSNVVIKVIGSLSWLDDIKPITSDDTHRVLITSEDGQSPNDLNRTTFNFPATGSEVVLPRIGGGYGLYMKTGVDFENIRVRITGDAAQSNVITMEGHDADSTVDIAFRKCRIRDESLHASRSFAFNVSSNAAEFSDCFIEMNGVANKVFGGNTVQRPFARNTVVATGAAQGTATLFESGSTPIINSVFLGISKVGATGAPGVSITNCFANTAQAANSVTAGLTINTTTGALTVNETTDFRPAAGGPLIDAATAAAQGTNDILGLNRGPTPDIGAWELTPFAPSPTGTITSIVVSGQTVTVSGTTANAPTSSMASLTLATTPYNSGVAQTGVAVTLGTGTFTVTFSNVAVGRYVPTVTLTNAGGGNAASNPQGNVDVLGASGTVTSQVLDGQQLTITGTTTGNPTAVPVLIPAAASNPNGAITATKDATLGSGTFTVTIALGAGNYDPGVVRFTTAAGTSLPITGTSAVSVIGITGNPEAPGGENPPPASTVSSVTVSPGTATGSATFSATVNGTNSPSQLVNWSATAGSINSAGVFTAPAQTGSVQTVTITATSVQDGTKSGTATVTIAAATAPATPTRSITLLLANASGATANLSNLSVSVHAEAWPHQFSTPIYATGTATTNGAGSMTISWDSALAAGTTVHLTVLGTNLAHFNGPVVLA